MSGRYADTRAAEVLARIAHSIHPSCPDEMLVVVTSTSGGIVCTAFPVKVGDIRAAIQHYHPSETLMLDKKQANGFSEKAVV